MAEGKVESMEKVRAPRAKTVPEPREEEAVVFAVFFDASHRFPCVALVDQVLRLYHLELAQLTPNSILKLSIFEWILRSAGTSGEGRLFVYLLDGRCQPKKDTRETLNFGSVNF